MSKPTILVTGATGHQGGEAARSLLAAGHNVRAFVRDASSPVAQALKLQGATLFEGDFFNLDSISAALNGITGVFLNTYPSFTDPEGEVRTAKTFVDAALQAGTVTNFVVSTVYHANIYDDWSVVAEKYPFLSMYFASKSGVEKVVRNAGFKSYTILRPCWLMHNYEGIGPQFHFPSWNERRITISYKPDWKQPHLDGLDVGKFAAAALAESPFSATYKNKEIDLVSQYLTWDEVARRLSEVTGVEVKTEFRTPQETEELLKAGSLPALEAQIFSQSLEQTVDVQEELAQYGIELGTFAQYTEREKEALKKSLGVE